MVPDFGIGLNNFLFENISNETLDNVAEKIAEQTRMFIPAITIENVEFITDETGQNMSRNEIQVIISYNILPFNERDELRILRDN